MAVRVLEGGGGERTENRWGPSESAGGGVLRQSSIAQVREWRVDDAPVRAGRDHERLRSQWPVLIRDHRDGYLGWARPTMFRLGGNRTNTGVPPTRRDRRRARASSPASAAASRCAPTTNSDQRPSHECSGRAPSHHPGCAARSPRLPQTSWPRGSTPSGSPPAPERRLTSRPYSGSRHDYHISAPNPLHRWGDSVAEAAHRLGCSVSVVYDWIKTGKLSTRRGTGNRQRIPWTEYVEAQCGRRITESGHLNPLAAAPNPAPDADRSTPCRCRRASSLRKTNRPTQLHLRREHPDPRLQEGQYETSVPRYRGRRVNGSGRGVSVGG